jgi:hypothetical protein
MSDTASTPADTSESGPRLLPNVAAMSDTQRQEEIGRLQRDPAFFAMFKDRLNPQYQDAKRVWDELHQPAAAMPSGPAGQPVAPGASRSQPLDLSRPFDVTGMPDDRKQEIIRAMQAKMPPAMLDRFHADNGAWRQMWDELHVPAQDAAPGASDLTQGEPVTLEHAAMLTTNMVSFTAATDDGRPLSLNDMAEARQLVASSVVALEATRTDASWLAATLNGAISRAKEGISQAEGMRRLTQQHGAATQQTISDAAAVLSHLESAGIPALEGMERLGVANDPDLITQLARFAKRLPALKAALASGGAGGRPR